MSAIAIITTIFTYLAVLFVISFLSGRRSDNEGFFIGNRRNSWWVATLAMIGAAMSGVTFVSVPGSVATDSFSYLQMVIGFTIGQLIVAFVLVPLFYRKGILSLYQYLADRYGLTTHRTGAWCFLLAKIISASLKVYIVAAMMQLLVFDSLGIPFTLNVVATMLIVWLYTCWGGVRSLIPTDIIQSLCLVAAVGIAIWALCRSMGLTLGDSYQLIASAPESQIFFFDDAASPRYFWKMVAGGALCLVAMTGLDQDMMQRNLSCRTARDSQINILLTALCQAIVITLFLALGVLLYRYIDFAAMPSPERGDDLFAVVAVQGGLPLVVGVAFIVGLNLRPTLPLAQPSPLSPPHSHSTSSPHLAPLTSPSCNTSATVSISLWQLLWLLPSLFLTPSTTTVSSTSSSASRVTPMVPSWDSSPSAYSLGDVCVSDLFRRL